MGNIVFFKFSKLGFCTNTSTQMKAILPRRVLRWQKLVCHILSKKTYFLRISIF